MLQAQFITPTVNGLITAGEYGNTLPGSNQVTSASVIWYCTWDANNLYFAINNANVSEAAVIHIDMNPTIPVNGGSPANGSVTWAYDYDRTRFHSPIRADFKLYVKDGYHEYRYSDGSGDWSAPVSNSLSVTALGSVIEFSIPWNTVSNGAGRPVAFNWYGYKLYNGGDGNNGMYAPVPQFNPTTPNNAGAGGTNEVYPVYYYTIINTDNLTSTPPFSARSFTYHQDFSAPGTGGYVINGSESFFDLTVNDNSSDNTDNDVAFDLYDNQEIANRVLIGGDVTISRNLVVGQGSALLPADNSSGSISASITMDGSTASIYNEGRIDCTPEVATVSDAGQRRLAFDIQGHVTYQSSSLFKDRARFSDLSISPGASLNGPPGSSAQIELQYGTLTNFGTLDCTSAGTGTLTFDTRGDSPSLNAYELSSPDSSGVFIMEGILIGRDSSILRPAVNGGLITLHVRGDFENYHRFIPRVSGGQIDVVMDGQGIQYLKGNSTETADGVTTFHRLEIKNDNGLGNNNSGADVHFESYGPERIDYLVTGELVLSSGDLVTRDRLDTSLVHRLILSEEAVVDQTDALSEILDAPSSYVDGPMEWIIQGPESDTLSFPIGKDGSYRETTLVVHGAQSYPDTLHAELFHSSANDRGNANPLVPESILNVSEVHWWKIGAGQSNSFDSVRMVLAYDTAGSGDHVTHPDDLRILKGPTGGGGVWENVSLFRGAQSSGSGVGTISSDAITGLGEFTFGNVGQNPLPVELLEFRAEAVADKIYLEWKTGMEVHSDHFLILYSRDGAVFEPLERVEAVGYSSVVQAYVTTHDQPANGWNYYKLIQFDMDGSEEELGLATVRFEEKGMYGVYPNPFSSVTRISMRSKHDELLIQVHDNSGKLICISTEIREVMELGQDWMPGTYWLSVYESGDKVHQELLIKR